MPALFVKEALSIGLVTLARVIFLVRGLLDAYMRDMERCNIKVIEINP